MRPKPVLILSLLLMPLGGCLVVGGSETTIRGAYIAREDLVSIQPGTTTQDEVLRALGPPTSRTLHEDGSESWTYRWTEEKESGGALFLIFAGGSRRSITDSITIVFRDGVVESIERR